MYLHITFKWINSPDVSISCIKSCHAEFLSSNLKIINIVDLYIMNNFVC